MACWTASDTRCDVEASVDKLQSVLAIEWLLDSEVERLEGLVELNRVKHDWCVAQGYLDLATVFRKRLQTPDLLLRMYLPMLEATCAEKEAHVRLIREGERQQSMGSELQHQEKPQRQRCHCLSHEERHRFEPQNRHLPQEDHHHEHQYHHHHHLHEHQSRREHHHNLNQHHLERRHNHEQHQHHQHHHHQCQHNLETPGIRPHSETSSSQQSTVSALVVNPDSLQAAGGDQNAQEVRQRVVLSQSKMTEFSHHKTLDAKLIRTNTHYMYNKTAKKHARRKLLQTKPSFSGLNKYGESMDSSRPPAMTHALGTSHLVSRETVGDNASLKNATPGISNSRVGRNFKWRSSRRGNLSTFFVADQTKHRLRTRASLLKRKKIYERCRHIAEEYRRRKKRQSFEQVSRGSESLPDSHQREVPDARQPEILDTHINRGDRIDRKENDFLFDIQADFHFSTFPMNRLE